MPTQVAKDEGVSELTRTSRGYFVAPLQEVSLARAHMGIDGAVALSLTAVLEIVLPALEQMIKLGAYLGPGLRVVPNTALILSLQRCTDLSDALAPK